MNKFQQLFEGYPYLAAEVMKKSAETSQNKFSKPNIQPESQVNKNIVQPLLNKVNSLKPKINNIKTSIVNKVNDINQNIPQNVKDETKYALASIPNYIKNPDLQRLIDLEKTVNNKSPRETYLAWKDNFAGQDTNPLNLNIPQDLKHTEKTDIFADTYDVENDKHKINSIFNQLNNIQTNNNINKIKSKAIDTMNAKTAISTKDHTPIIDKNHINIKNLQPNIIVSSNVSPVNAVVTAHETKEAIEANKRLKQLSNKTNEIKEDDLNKFNMAYIQRTPFYYDLPGAGAHFSPYVLSDENTLMKKMDDNYKHFNDIELIKNMKDDRNRPMFSAGSNYINWKSGDNPPNKIQFNPYETTQHDIATKPELQKEFFDNLLKSRLNKLEMEKFNQNIGKNSVIPNGLGGAEGPDRGPDLGVKPSGFGQNLLNKSKQYINNITNRFK